MCHLRKILINGKTFIATEHGVEHSCLEKAPSLFCSPSKNFLFWPVVKKNCLSHCEAKERITTIYFPFGKQETDALRLLRASPPRSESRRSKEEHSPLITVLRVTQILPTGGGAHEELDRRLPRLKQKNKV